MDTQELGRYVTVVTPDSPNGDAYHCVEQHGDRLLLEPVLANCVAPQAGQKVRCLSSAGEWESSVLADGTGRVALTVPSWVTRPVERKAVRVVLSAPVMIVLEGDRWPGQVADLSVTGASVVVEKAAAIAPGAEIGCTLPEGQATATVRNLRLHEHPLLEVLGIAWRHLDEASSAWVRETVATWRSTPRA